LFNIASREVRYRFIVKGVKVKKIIGSLVSAVLLVSISTVGNAQSYSSEKIDKMIGRMDDSGDGKVGFQEYFEQTVTDSSDSYDVNKDGYITSGEVVLEIKEGLIETIALMRKQGVSEENINKTIASELNTAEKEAALIIKKMDADKDGLVEPSELKQYKKKQFRKLDKNHDGVISRKDVKRNKGFPIHQY